MTTLDWIDRDGRLTHGKHQGETVESVAKDDPGYLRWCLGNVESMSDEDRSVIEAHLSLRGRL